VAWKIRAHQNNRIDHSGNVVRALRSNVERPFARDQSSDCFAQFGFR
jgi:hypothetical protein